MAHLIHAPTSLGLSINVMATQSHTASPDLLQALRFSARDGRIWLDEQRMLLIHAGALATMRRELVDSIGPDHTRRLLLRVGFASGQRDGALAQQLRPHATLDAMFSVGPQLHMLEGAVRVTQEQLELDREAGRFFGQFRWDDSWEVEAHQSQFGPAQAPVCWMLLGYASGYTSAFMGRLVVYREVLCAACGHAHCRIEGRLREDWPDGDTMAHDYAPAALLDQLQTLQSQVQALRSTLAPRVADPAALVGRAPAFAQALDLLTKAAATQVTVLLTGETGVGKERFARALHAQSARHAGPFVAVNCAAIPAELVESELFGAERGAYTGAATARPGRFERADGGTLLLDELGELPLPAQAKLLRVLQDGEVERLGGTQPRRVNVRVIAATHVDLQAAVAAGRFRQDLLYRLNVYPIRIPPLRERQADIEPLARHLLLRFAALHDKAVPGFSDRALHALKRHDWPGNVRELENLVERGVILAQAGEPIDASTLFPGAPDDAGASPNAQGRLEPVASGPVAQVYADLAGGRTTLEAVEDQLILEAVRRADGNLVAAARTLGLSRPQTRYRWRRAQARQTAEGR
jgi:DNA-binding NtrC family response regulator